LTLSSEEISKLSEDINRLLVSFRAKSPEDEFADLASRIGFGYTDTQENRILRHLYEKTIDSRTRLSAKQIQAHIGDCSNIHQIMKRLVERYPQCIEKIDKKYRIRRP